jgi:hypothetical protein
MGGRKDTVNKRIPHLLHCRERMEREEGRREGIEERGDGGGGKVTGSMSKVSIAGNT